MAVSKMMNDHDHADHGVNSKQWRIQLWVDRAPSPIDHNFGLVAGAWRRHGGNLSLKSLTFGHFCIKMDKKLSSSGEPPDPSPGALPPETPA